MAPMSHDMRDLFAAMAIGAATSQAFLNANSKMLVSDSTSAFLASQADMGSSYGNRSYKGMDGTYPQVALNVLTFRATFTTSEANHDWDDWGIKNSSVTSSGVGITLMNRKIDPLGLKASTQSWQATAQITVTT